MACRFRGLEHCACISSRSAQDLSLSTIEPQSAPERAAPKAKFHVGINGYNVSRSFSTIVLHPVAVNIAAST